jgi:hypothetical protein
MKNIIFLLIVPSVMFLTAAAFAFFEAGILHSNHVAIHTGDRYQKCEAFVGRVLDGRQQATAEQYMQALQDQQWAIKAEGNMSDSVADDLRFFGYIAVFSLLAQIAAIYKIWQRLKKP